jgi:plasmid stabilization system protein ParE
MNFTVTWTRAALRQFLDLWTGATDPDAVDAAALRIDQTLSTDAHQQGEGRTDPIRILFDPPLAVLFVADVDVAVVYVVSVGWSGAPA